MDYSFISAICAITGTMVVLLLYVYLYELYRKPYMGAWIIGWLVHFTRICLFESRLIDWQDSAFYGFIYQALTATCGIILLYSAHLAIDKPLSKRWLEIYYGAVLLGAIFSFTQGIASIKIIPAFFASGMMLFCIGKIFISKLKLKGLGNYIAGYGFLLWGIVTIAYPFFCDHTIYPVWLIAVSGICRLIVACGTLLVYFEINCFELIEKASYYRSLADSAVDILYRYQLVPEIKMEYISPSVYQVTGFKPEEYYNDPKLYEKFVHPDDLWKFNAYMANPAWCMDIPIEYRIIHKNNKIIHIEQNYSPTFNEHGKLAGRQGILRNVTARNAVKQSERKADQLNVLGKMAANISQTLRTPLVHIGCRLQMFKNKIVTKITII